MENLWPSFQKKEVVTPKSILESQVNYFNSFDTGLKAKLSTSLEGSTLEHYMRIQVPALNGFTINVFKASNSPTNLYPVDVYDFINSTSYKTQDKESLESVLKKIFNSEKLISNIENLLAQIAEDDDELPF